MCSFWNCYVQIYMCETFGFQIKCNRATKRCILRYWDAIAKHIQTENGAHFQNGIKNLSSPCLTDKRERSGRMPSLLLVASCRNRTLLLIKSTMYCKKLKWPFFNWRPHKHRRIRALGERTLSQLSYASSIASANAHRRKHAVGC